MKDSNSVFNGSSLKRQKDQEKKQAENGLNVKRPSFVHVNISMSEECRRKLLVIAEKNETTASQLIRSWIIEKYDEII